MQQQAPGLRERQLQLTRETILDACADLVNQRRHLGFTMQEIATSAGMALRTLYNHFPTRDDLLDALLVHLDERMEVLGAVSTDDLALLAEVPEAVRVNFGIFEALGGVSEAVAQMSVTEAHRNLERNARTDRFVAMAASQWPQRDLAQARRLGLLVRHLASLRSWFALTRDYGLTTEDAADVVAHTIGLLSRETALRGERDQA